MASFLFTLLKIMLAQLRVPGVGFTAQRPQARVARPQPVTLTSGNVLSGCSIGSSSDLTGASLAGLPESTVGPWTMMRHGNRCVIDKDGIGESFWEAFSIAQGLQRKCTARLPLWWLAILPRHPRACRPGETQPCRIFAV